MYLPHFSYDSLVLMTIVNLLTTGGVMMFIWNVDRPGPGLTEMALGDLLVGFGLVIAAFKNLVPGGTIGLLSNLAVFAGAVLLLNGMRAFRGLDHLSAPLLSTLSSAYACAILYRTFGSDDVAVRASIESGTLALLTLAMAGTMLTRVPLEDRRLYFFSAALLTLHALSLGLRAGWAVTHRLNGAYFSGSPADYTVLFTLNFVVTGCCLAVATASSRKLYHTTRKLALHDPLTQLPNRRMFEDRISELRGSGTRVSIALIYIDLDNFKVVNETFGHSGGDQVLRIVGERLMAQFVETGLPARVGGDEFVVLLEGVQSRAAALMVMEKAIAAIQAEIRVGHESIYLELSGGMALYPEDVESLSDLAGVADRRMYRSKRGQRQFAPCSGPIRDSRLSASPNTMV
jgi:diguanylate cyclase (GGDEF)-like protein